MVEIGGYGGPELYGISSKAFVYLLLQIMDNANNEANLDSFCIRTSSRAFGNNPFCQRTCIDGLLIKLI